MGPLAYVLTSVGPDVAAIAVLFIVEIVSFIESSILPAVYPVSVHVAIQPLTFV